jgi:hypothetical protein
MINYPWLAWLVVSVVHLAAVLVGGLLWGL